MSSPLSPAALAELKTLGELRESGILSQSEFESEKSRIMSTAAASLDVTESEEAFSSGSQEEDLVTEQLQGSDTGGMLSSVKGHLEHGLADVPIDGAWAKLKFAFGQAKSRGPGSLALFIGRCYLAIITYGLSELVYRKLIRPRIGGH